MRRARHVRAHGRSRNRAGSSALQGVDELPRLLLRLRKVSAPGAIRNRAEGLPESGHVQRLAAAGGEQLLVAALAAKKIEHRVALSDGMLERVPEQDVARTELRVGRIEAGLHHEDVLCAPQRLRCSSASLSSAASRLAASCQTKKRVRCAVASLRRRLRMCQRRWPLTEAR